MKSEAVVAILAPEGLAQVAASCQHARRSFVPPNRLSVSLAVGCFQHVPVPPVAPIAQGLVYDINAPHTSGLRESKHAYRRSSTPIAQGLVYDINAPHAFGLRESKPNAIMRHAYGRSSAPIAQGLVYDTNAPHAFGLRESKPNAMHAYGRSSTPIFKGWCMT